MILHINTTENNEIMLELIKNEKIIDRKKILAPKKQAELLLPGIEKMLSKNGFSLNDLKKVKVDNSGGSFTSLRIGVVTANALAYALNIDIEAQDKKDFKKAKKIKLIPPKYSQEPQIIIKKKKLV